MLTRRCEETTIIETAARVAMTVAMIFTYAAIIVAVGHLLAITGV